MQGWFVVIVAVAYVTLLFAIASLGDRKSAGGAIAAYRPYIYALSLAIYCTSWTFFGSVGLAAERGLEFVAIYIGPVLVFLFGVPLLQPHRAAGQGREDHLHRRLSRRTLWQELPGGVYRHTDRDHRRHPLHRVATQGDFRLGQPDGGALQRCAALLRSLRQRHLAGVAMLLALFAVLFGTRHADATEHQDGLVLAVAVESVVKLAAFLAIASWRPSWCSAGRAR